MSATLTPAPGYGPAAPAGPAGVGQWLRSSLRLLWIEVRRSQGYWLLPLMLGLGLLVPLNYSDDGVVFWDDLNNRVVQSYVVIGPLAAVLGAWIAGRDRRRRVEGLVATVPGLGFRRDLLALCAASCWGLAAYVMVFAWLGWQGVRHATWGGPAPLLLLTGVLGIVLFTAVGAFIGRIASGRFSPLIALVVTFLLTIGSDAFKITDASGASRQPLKLLMPWGLVSDGYPDVFYGSSAPYELEVVVWLTGATGVALGVLALLRNRSAWIAVPMAASLLVAGTGATALIERGEPWGGYRSAAPFEWSCRSESGVEVCLHPAYEARLDETATIVIAMISPLVGLDGVPMRWLQHHPDWIDDGAAVAQLYNVESHTIQVAVAQELFGWDEGRGGVVSGFRPASELVFLHWLAGLPGHELEFGWPFGWPAEVPHTEASMGPNYYNPPVVDETALAAFIPTFDAAVERFAALAADERRTWLEANWDALRAGDLALKDLP